MTALASSPTASALTRARQRAALWFLLPVTAVLLAVAGWPLARTVFFAFTDASLDNLAEKEFVGFGNFTYLLTDPQWWHAVGNTLYFAFISVSCETALGLVIALALNAHLPGRGVLRAAIMIPWAIPTIVSAQMWGWMYHDLYGIINDVLLRIGLIHEAKAWAADPHLAMFAVILADVWKTTPFMALLILAALQILPQECYESARVDGVHPVRVFFRITLPLIAPALTVAVIFRALDALRVFDLIYALTSNNPQTMSMSVYVRQQLVEFQDVGYGSAAATALFMVITLLTALILTFSKTRLVQEAA